MTIWARIKWLVLHIDTSPATVCSILSGAFWATCLWMPGDTLARPTYRYMAQVATEEAWSIAFATLAVLQLWRLGARPFARWHYVDFAIKVGAVSLWCFVAVACLASQWPIAAAMSDTAVIAIACVWDFLRCDPRHGCIQNSSMKCLDCAHACGEPHA